MEDKYTEELIAQIEQYISGEMGREEKKDFEKKMAEDEEFRNMVEQHRMLVEGVQVAAYQSERERWASVQSAIDLDEIKVDEIAEKTTERPPVKIRKISSFLSAMAAGLLIGFLAAQLFLNNSGTSHELPQNDIPIAQTGDDEEMPLGDLGNEIDHPVKYILAKRAAGDLEIVSENERQIKLVAEDLALPYYQLNDNVLEFNLPENTMSYFMQNELEWWEIDGEQYLKLGDKYFPLFSTGELEVLGGISFD